MSKQSLLGYIEAQMQLLTYIKDPDTHQAIKRIWETMHRLVLELDEDKS